MSWREELQPAEFRGALFFVDGHEAALGRRVQVHEYPQRDKPYAEDLGRKSRKFTVEAFVLGAGYMGNRDTLLRAVERAGAGQLIHPYFGSMQAACVGCTVRESSAEGGVARFTLEFVEAGEAVFPLSAVSTSYAVLAAADAASQAVQDSCAARHKVAGRPQFVAAASERILGNALATMRAAVGGVKAAGAAVAALNRDIDEVQRDLITLLYEPAEAAQALARNMRQLVRTVTTDPMEQLGLARSFWRFGSLLPPVLANTGSRRAQQINQAELLQLVRVCSLAEGARAASLVAFASFQDAVQARDEMAQALDDVLMAEPDDGTYTAVRALRAAMVQDMAARGANLARLVQWVPTTTMPSLAVAQAVYADALREPELVERNRIRHPLFVPATVPLEVLSNGV